LLDAPEIFNTDQGSQFTSEEWLAPLKAAGVAISMDGKGRWIDNVFIERLWRSVKYEEVYLRAYANGHGAQHSLSKYFAFYNARRLLETLGYATRRGVLRRSGRHRAGGSLKLAELLPPLRGVRLHCGEDIDEDRRGRDHHHQPPRQIHLSRREICLRSGATPLSPARAPLLRCDRWSS